ncbi:hypothetical protein BJ170DRAFT_606714 [Xylariales sp. AK1849]|nr:hypothetical protein BJ170DRAFT_606714 [Xylariales sp. AK1849]
MQQEPEYGGLVNNSVRTSLEHNLGHDDTFKAKYRQNKLDELRHLFEETYGETQRELELKIISLCEKTLGNLRSIFVDHELEVQSLYEEDMKVDEAWIAALQTLSMSLAEANSGRVDPYPPVPKFQPFDSDKVASCLNDIQKLQDVYNAFMSGKPLTLSPDCAESAASVNESMELESPLISGDESSMLSSLQSSPSLSGGGLPTASRAIQVSQSTHDESEPVELPPHRNQSITLGEAKGEYVCMDYDSNGVQ